MTSSYHPPVDRLLTLGAEPASRRVWPDYRHLGLSARHVPELVRMATDAALLAAEEKEAASWAPLHAWRALGQLEAPAAVAPLLGLLERAWEDDAVYDEIPIVLGMIGAPALPGATLWLFDEARDWRLRIAAGRILAEVGHEYPDRRDEAAAVLVQQLQDWPHQDRVLNGFLIANLAELGEVAAAPLMEAAFAAGAVDLAVAGDWEDVQVALGLLEERLTDPQPARRAPASPKAKRKAEKQAR
ncbi:MAG TPA: hypothetical protein VGO40_05685, partial [Longimicrobium sp.]|nr:hypothetical protein [Longimicrobium sp.]